MRLFRRSEKAQYRTSLKAFEQINARFNAAMAKGSQSELNAVRDDVWDLQMELARTQMRDVPSAAVSWALICTARLSLQISASTGQDWTRVVASGGLMASALSLIDARFTQQGAPLPREILSQMTGIATISAYAAHRCATPVTGIMVAEAITSMALGDRMMSRELAATADIGGLPALQQIHSALRKQPHVSSREARRELRRAERSELGLPEIMQQQFEQNWLASDGPDEQQSLVTSPFAVSSVRAAASSGRTLIYVAPGPSSGAALRVNPPDSHREMYESAELPDLDIGTVRREILRIRKVYADAQSGIIGEKALTKTLKQALDRVSAAFWTPLLADWPDLFDTRTALVPLGESGLLPLYTSPVDGEPACGLLDVTIVPSGRALLLASSWPHPATGADVLVAADPWYGADEIPRTVPEAREVARIHGVEPMIFRDPDSAVTSDRQLLDRTSSHDEVPLRMLAADPPPGAADAVPDEAPGQPAERIVGRLSEASLIHLACHGDLRSDEPLASSLLLGKRMPLSVLLERDLLPGTTVVLSACELGSIAGDLPDEQLGFPAALLAMGARSVIGALWPVPDEDATVSLMAETHRRLSASSGTLALGQAIRRAHADGVPPAIWASFTHFGV
ncbi:CHAT domain-containing protein [Streptomyces microflavus]|uniref:CHAT domain-containing protein n=1 Tax=Streptomyces microflavus TaxID=1919 RepID=UPI0038057F5D